MLKPNEVQKVKAIAGLVLLAICFQNFKFVDELKITLTPINEDSRAAHAKELLGKYYKGSFAAQAENVNAMHFSVFNDVYRSLPKSHKAKALDVSSTIIDEAFRYDFDPVFVMAVIKTESSFNPKAIGGIGEVGLMQLRPETAEWIAKISGIDWRGREALKNPVYNVRLGVAYLHWLRTKFGSSPNKYLSAYNLGAAKVRRMYASELQPKEYSGRVMKNYNEIYLRIVAKTNPSLVALN